MSRKTRYWLWFLMLIPIGAGLARLRFDVEVLNLLPDQVPVVHGLKLYQQNFANARELIVTLRAPDAESAEQVARAFAETLRENKALVSAVTWQPPWLEHPDQAAELIAYLWLNQPPEVFGELNRRLAPTNLPAILRAAREQLATSMSPQDIGRMSYDPYGMMSLPETAVAAAPSFQAGHDFFASADGMFRLIFVKAAADAGNYRAAIAMMGRIKAIEQVWRRQKEIDPEVRINYTGGPAFAAEISSGMERDLKGSIGGTALIIAFLFWLAHRRWKPMLWLLTLLALVLFSTLAMGGLLFGTINVVSMGFAAILLGLAVDYAVVHYQEALAHPGLSVPEIRRAIAPSIFWAAATTIAAFLVLNFGGLPGLAQLGSLVALGVGLAATLMIFAYLPPLFPDRRVAKTSTAQHGASATPGEPPRSTHVRVVYLATVGMILAALVILAFGLPRMDATADPLRPRRSSAFAALEEIKAQLGQKQEPLWLLVSGRDETEVARRLDAVQPMLEQGVSNQVIGSITLPAALWPRPEFQRVNRATARTLAGRRDELRSAAKTAGFADIGLAFTDGILATWTQASATLEVFWPTNEMSGWIFDKLIARTPTNLFALGLIQPATNRVAGTDAAISALAAKLSGEGVWLSGWELLGAAIFDSVRANMWKLLVPMIALVLASLWFAFRRLPEVLLSVAILLLSGLGLLSVMKVAGWSWNLLNLMSLPLILGTGVDYSIFMQLGLRRHNADLKIAHRSVGRALFLCGAAAVAGFASLAFSSNAGMASLGQVCAVGIAFNVVISVLLLPVWWRTAMRDVSGHADSKNEPGTSSLYGIGFWRLGLILARALPRGLSVGIARTVSGIYAAARPTRREIVVRNLMPVLNNDRRLAEKTSHELFQQFAVKITELLRFEAGLPVENLFAELTGWEHFVGAQKEERGVLLLTPHLGNWEFGAPLLTQRGYQLQVITLVEPGSGLTELRQASRARWGTETLVIGEDPFAIVEVIRRLEVGATVALLVDRPPATSAVTVELFGRPFAASIAAAELARASGCVLLPVYLPRNDVGYAAHILPGVPYDRTALRQREARRQLTQEIMRAFEPAIRQHLDQWYHFVPIWPK